MKVLAYDGDCMLCRGMSRLLVRRWLTGDAVRKPFNDFDDETALRLVEAEIHNEMAVLDPESGEVRSGFAGILWVLEGGILRWFAWLLALPGVRHLCSFFYRVAAYNRRILAPLPARKITCACDPDPRPLYQWSFILICLVLTSLWWVPLFRFPWPLGLMGIAALSCGLCLLAAMDLLSLLRDRQEVESGLLVIGHLAWIMLLSVVPLFLVSLVNPTFRFDHSAMPALHFYLLAVIVGIFLTTILTGRRLRLLGFFSTGMFMTPVLLWGAAYGSVRLAGWMHRLLR